MAGEYKFPKVYPVDSVTFFNGEQPTPAKFTGIFRYINAAFFSIESFMGNGLDFNKPGPGKDRYNILNLSTSLGHTDKIYSSLNQLDRLYDITYRYAHTDQEDVLDKASFDSNIGCIMVKDNFSIPIGKEFDDDMLLCIHFSIKDTVVPLRNGLAKVEVWYAGYDADVRDPDTYDTVDMSVSSVVKNTQNIHGAIKTDWILKYTSLAINKEVDRPKTRFVEAINVDRNLAGEFAIFSIALVATSDAKILTGYKSSDNTAHSIPLNLMYALGDQAKDISGTNVQSYKYRLRCKNASVCSKATVNGVRNNYCIGNTYDFYVNDGDNINRKVGKPECAGSIFKDYGPNSVDADLIPKDLSNATIWYEGNLIETPPIVVFQSPLYCTDKQNIMRFHPLFVSNSPSNTAIGDNLSGVYDTQSATSPIITTSMLKATGTRPDQAWLENKNKEIDLNSTSRYYIVGGKFGVADMVESAVNLEKASHRMIAVYAE